MIQFLKHLRDLWYKYIIWHKYKIGKNFHCGRGTFIWARNKIEIGDNFYLGKFSSIETNCIIGNNVIIANHVGIVGRYDHNYQQIGIPVRLASQIRDKNYSWKGLDEITYMGQIARGKAEDLAVQNQIEMDMMVQFMSLIFTWEQAK